MDILNDINDNMNNNDMDPLNENNSSNNEEEDNIDHNRLRELANYADQNRDTPAGAPFSQIPDSDREEIRVGETKMVSHQEPDRYEGTGISLNWGEYYVPDNDDESSISCEEAEEINEEEVNSEDNQAHSHTLATLEKDITLFFPMNYDQLDNNVDASNPSLMGMPDIILEKILDYSIGDHHQRSDACTVELVCKRIRRLITNDTFWIRRHNNNPKFTRIGSLQRMALLQIRYYQKSKSSSNAILDVLGDGSECVASTFRTISAGILSRMTHHGEAHFRLRGDTIGYIAELLQGYMIDRLEAAILLAIHRQGPIHEDDTWLFPRRVVQTDDIVLAFRRQTRLPSLFSSCSPNLTRCDVSAGHHGQVESLLDCSCSLPSSSGIVWRWPLDNCHEVLPVEAGRRIIRRLAYIAGIPEMSNEAFILAEAELLHALGGLLVSAYESCVNIEQKGETQLLDEEQELAYNKPNVPFDMFRSPPPPFYHPDVAVVHTIVPGQIEAAAEQRGITPSKVYGDVWIAISGFSPEEEEETETSYYYKETFHDDDSEESASDSDYSENEDNIDSEMDVSSREDAVSLETSG